MREWSTRRSGRSARVRSDGHEDEMFYVDERLEVLVVVLEKRVV
jgi:hypothetical protein